MNKFHYFGCGMLLLTLPSALILLAGGVLTATNRSKPIFRPASEVAAFQYLDEIAIPEEIVLSSFETGNVLPVWTPVRVVIGHGPESVWLERLQPRVEAFYQPGTSEVAREELLKQFGVRYVFWGPAERGLGDWNPKDAGYLHVVYEADGYVILEVEGELESDS